ncbi:hypothetical protein QTI66_19445 [Variovorax sp. J22R133]|uniref:hypothetical protein n=1 Tax=Variovorax brevis TaxID=3053503 RepID=UPI0025785C89|nr:hypothetical protein [Variovorax sp. J22R133]MDM0114338.1 hypothetical protein [Variovorax sp. J22R133]
MRRLFQRWVLSRLWLTFVVLCLSFLAFGIGSLNLVYLFQANATFLAEQGWQAVMDGALVQLTQLILNGVLSMVAYVIFKTCEHRLSHWLADEH